MSESQELLARHHSASPNTRLARPRTGRFFVYLRGIYTHIVSFVDRSTGHLLSTVLVTIVRLF